MRIRDNFYFWASIVFLFFFLLVVFYIYQEEYELANLIDTKTILLVLGTLGGAFLGALFASRYATDHIIKQMKHQSNLQNESILSTSQKYSIIALAIIETLYEETSEQVNQDLSDVDSFDNWMAYLNSLTNNIEVFLEELQSLDLIKNVNYDINVPMYRSTLNLRRVMVNTQRYIGENDKKEFGEEQHILFREAVREPLSQLKKYSEELRTEHENEKLSYLQVKQELQQV